MIFDISVCSLVLRCARWFDSSHRAFGCDCPRTSFHFKASLVCAVSFRWGLSAGIHRKPVGWMRCDAWSSCFRKACCLFQADSRKHVPTTLAWSPLLTILTITATPTPAIQLFNDANLSTRGNIRGLGKGWFRPVVRFWRFVLACLLSQTQEVSSITEDQRRRGTYLRASRLASFSERPIADHRS